MKKTISVPRVSSSISSVMHAVLNEESLVTNMKLLMVADEVIIYGLSWCGAHIHNHKQAPVIVLSFAVRQAVAVSMFLRELLISFCRLADEVSFLLFLRLRYKYMLHLRIKFKNMHAPSSQSHCLQTHIVTL